MEFLKKYFPLSWKYTKSGREVVKGILIYLLLSVAAGIALWFTSIIFGWIPFLGAVIKFLLNIASGAVYLYAALGDVLIFLVKYKVL